MSKVKPIWHSKTLWFNLAATAMAVLADNSGLLRESLSSGGYVLLLMAISAGNVFLRTLTTTGVRLK